MFQFLRDLFNKKHHNYDDNFAVELVNNSPIAKAYWTPDLRVGFANQAYLKLVNRSAEQLKKTTLQQLLGDELFEENRGHIAAALSGTVTQFELNVIDDKDAAILLNIEYVPYLRNGKPHGFFSILTNITAQRQGEDLRRISELALEAISQGVIITDSKGIILSVNYCFESMLGYSKEEVIGKTPKFLQGPLSDPKMLEEMHNIHNGKEFSGEVINYRKNGTAFWNELTIAPVINSKGEITNYIGTCRDITGRKESEEEIKLLAYYDPLTKLPNRRLLLDQLKKTIAVSVRHGLKGSLLFLDLDNFKSLNDTKGHIVGDMLLEQVGKRLVTCIREGDTVARLGGDEFVIMLSNLSGKEIEARAQAEAVANKILVSLNHPYELGRYQHHCTPSIGITMFGSMIEDVTDPLKRADVAMYQAKAAGRNTYKFFDPEIQEIVTSKLKIENGLREAIVDNQFLLFCQSQVNSNGEITGFEALIRWHKPNLGLISPNEFIPVAEETGMILPIGNWVIETACTKLAQWATIPHMANLTLAINVSMKQFVSADFVENILAAVSKHGIDPSKLKLELTESAMAKDIELIIEKMIVLRGHKMTLSLDDFGTGYSSLAYLKRMPLDQLKIDQSFVRNILIDENDAAIAKTIIALAGTLGLNVIAEGVETEGQRTCLFEQGCFTYQGYLFSRPFPIDNAIAFVEEVQFLKSN